MTEIIKTASRPIYLAKERRKIRSILKIIILLIAVSLIVAGGFLFAFFWAVKDGQYDDEHTPAMKLLIDSDMLSSDSDINESKQK